MLEKIEAVMPIVNFIGCIIVGAVIYYYWKKRKNNDQSKQ